jgi:hypothetical protein
MFPIARQRLGEALDSGLDALVEFATLGEYRVAGLRVCEGELEETGSRCSVGGTQGCGSRRHESATPQLVS